LTHDVYDINNTKLQFDDNFCALRSTYFSVPETNSVPLTYVAGVDTVIALETYWPKAYSICTHEEVTTNLVYTLSTKSGDPVPLYMTLEEATKSLLISTAGLKEITDLVLKV
jgi:hypothetical protein